MARFPSRARRERERDVMHQSAALRRQSTTHEERRSDRQRAVGSATRRCAGEPNEFKSTWEAQLRWIDEGAEAKG